MMKKGIICGVCAVTLILFLTPTIPAQQYRLVNDTIKKEFQQQLDVAIATLRDIGKDTSKLEDQKKIVMNSFNEMKQILNLGGLDTLPTCFKFLLNTLLSLILAALGTLFGIVFGPLFTFLVKIITFPAVLLAKILEMIFNGNAITTA